MKRIWLLAGLLACLVLVWLLGSGRLAAQESAVKSPADNEAAAAPATAEAPATAAARAAAAAAARTAAKAAGAGEAEKDEPKFIRVRRSDKGKPLAMETSVVRYVSPERPGVKVDLVGAIHIGDKSYYDELNKLFDSYDVVLYELVAPEGTKIPKEGRPGQQRKSHWGAAKRHGGDARIGAPA